MKGLTVRLLLILTATVLATVCDGQGYKKLGTAGMKFLDIDPSARSAAMGGALNSICQDVSSIFLNPAGMSFIPRYEFSLSYNSWIADIKQYALGGAINLSHIGLKKVGGVLGVSLLYTDNGDMIRTEYLSTYRDYVQYEEPYTIEEWAVGIAYAKQITDRFSFGGHVKYVVQDLGETPVWRAVENDTITIENRLAPVAFDFGTIYDIGFYDIKLSMSFRNFSQELIYVRDKFELPITMRIGLSMNVLKLFRQAEDGQSLLVAIDALHPRDYTERIHLGVEYMFKILAIRAGYRFNYDEENFCAGFGVNQLLENTNLKIDYAYSSFGIFDPVHRFTVGFSF